MLQKPSNIKKLVEKIVQDIKNKKLNKLFVTGTDTSVGKTFICCEILKEVQRIDQQLNVIAKKPIATGCKRNYSGRIISGDVEQLFKALNGKVAIDEICSFMFEGNISPQLAIQNNMLYVSINDMLMFCESSADFNLIEGSGGFYSPLASDGVNADLARQLDCPIMFVVKDQLGCINHTLLTVEAVKSRNLSVYAIVLNQFPDSPTDTLQQFMQREELKDIMLVSCKKQLNN